MDPNIAGVAPSQDIPESVTNTEGIVHENIFKRWYERYKALPPFKKLVVVGIGFLIIVLLLVCLIYGYILISGYQKGSGQTDQGAGVTPTPTPTPVTMTNPLTGQVVTGDAIKNLERPPLAVMIENSIPARPQTGLNQADIVYEALAEGGITRFMAVFLGNTPQMVGPVRSARTYFLDWVSEYNAIYAHWGENSDVAPSLGPDSIRNVDALVMPGTGDNCTSANGLFCRDNTRYAPHNGYGFPDRIWHYGASRGWTGATNITSWQFKDDATMATRGKDGSVISIDFMPYDTDYSVKWTYDRQNNDYVRSNGGTQQVDRADGQPITAKNVVLEFVDGNVYTSSGGKDVYHLNDTGTGKASIFEDGTEIDGTWQKSGLSSRTTFTDNAGKAISFDKGRSWMTILVNGQGNFTVNT